MENSAVGSMPASPAYMDQHPLHSARRTAAYNLLSIVHIINGPTIRPLWTSKNFIMKPIVAAGSYCHLTAGSVDRLDTGCQRF